METDTLARTTASVVTALACLLLAYMWGSQNRTGKTVNLWLCSGVAGVLLGCAGFFGVLHFSGYSLQKVVKLGADDAAKMMGGGMGGGMGGKGGGGKGGGGMGGGMGAGKGGGMGGAFQPSQKMLLTSLVRKLDVLTGDVAIKLSDAQKEALNKELAELETLEKLSDVQAQKKLEAINAILDESQKVKHAAISLPFGKGGRPGGGGGGGTPNPDPNANPFAEENSLKALKAFRSRL